MKRKDFLSGASHKWLDVKICWQLSPCFSTWGFAVRRDTQFFHVIEQVRSMCGKNQTLDTCHDHVPRSAAAWNARETAPILLRNWRVLYILTWTNAFRHSGAQFWRIRCLKSAPKLTCFVHFYFKMRVSPQRRAILAHQMISPQRHAFFRHRIFKKCSEAGVFCTFWLQNMLFATAACNFSTSHLQKVPRSWRVLYILTSNCAVRHFSTAKLQKVLRHRQFLSIFTSKCAFRQSGVQFLMSPLRTYLRTRRFNRPTFRLTRHTNHWKNTAFRDVSNIWRGCVFFLLTFVLVHLRPSDLTACLICFSTLHLVGSLLFKLPSIICLVGNPRKDNNHVFWWHQGKDRKSKSSASAIHALLLPANQWPCTKQFGVFLQSLVAVFVTCMDMYIWYL